jgi:hypothetical protein
MNVIGQVEKFKARLVAKVYSQVEGVDFGDIFSLVEKLTFIRVIMSLATDGCEDNVPMCGPGRRNIHETT